MKEYLEIFKCLSDETRLRLLHLLIKADSELCGCELADSLEVPQYNVSRHLKILSNTGLIEERKEGRWVYFGISKGKSSFRKAILKSVSCIPHSLLAKDQMELKKRFKLRMNGKCILGIQKKHLLKVGRKRYE